MVKGCAYEYRIHIYPAIPTHATQSSAATNGKRAWGFGSGLAGDWSMTNHNSLYRIWEISGGMSFRRSSRTGQMLQVQSQAASTFAGPTWA